MTYAIGDTVPPFILPRVEGGLLSVDPRSRAATVVVFTANHCPYALAWHGRINEVARDYASRGVSVIQINANDEQIQPADSIQASADRVAAGQFSGPYLHDGTQDLARAFGAEKTPDVFIIDGSGQLAYHGAPDADHAQDKEQARYIRNALEDVLAGHPVQIPETAAIGCGIKWSTAAAESSTIGTAHA